MPKGIETFTIECPSCTSTHIDEIWVDRKKWDGRWVYLFHMECAECGMKFATKEIGGVY